MTKIHWADQREKNAVITNKINFKGFQDILCFHVLNKIFDHY